MACQFKFIAIVALLMGSTAIIEATDFIIFNESPLSFHDCTSQRNQVLSYWDDCNLQLPFDDCPLRKRRSVDEFENAIVDNEARYTQFRSELSDTHNTADSFLKFGHPLYARLAPLDLEKVNEKCCMPAPNPPIPCSSLSSLCPAGSMYHERTYEQMILGGCEIFIEENL